MNRAFLSSRWQSFRRLSPAEQYFQGMFWTFFAYIVSFSGGFGVREVLPVLAGIFLAGYYYHNWEKSNLRRLPLRWALVCFACSLCWAVVVSLDPWESFLHVGRGLNKQYLIFFVALEAARGEKELRRLVWALVLGVFWQGLNCLYQEITGVDFIQGAALKAGRLTGSFGSYWVGNYFALTLVPVFGLWYILSSRLGFWECAVLLLACCWPALYGIAFSGVRDAVFTLFSCGIMALCYLSSHRRLSVWSWICFFLVILVLLMGIMVIRPGALTVTEGIHDGRWSLWQLGWAVFQHYPLTGVGAHQYNTAFRMLGLVPLRDVITISHPHNIYLHVLCETGIIGFLLTFIPFFSLLYWAGRRLHPLLCAEYRNAAASIRWRLTFFFVMGFVAFLVNGITGHDFYRPWYQAIAFSHLGIALGSLVCGEES